MNYDNDIPCAPNDFDQDHEQYREVCNFGVETVRQMEVEQEIEKEELDALAAEANETLPPMSEAGRVIFELGLALNRAYAEGMKSGPPNDCVTGKPDLPSAADLDRVTDPTSDDYWFNLAKGIVLP